MGLFKMRGCISNCRFVGSTPIKTILHSHGLKVVVILSVVNGL